MSKSASSRAVQVTVWGILAAVIVVISGLYFYRDFPKPKTGLPVYSQVQPFLLTNQLGSKVTLGDLSGRVWVADIIFTQCAGPCPRMTRTMSSLQTNLPASVQLITLTTDPTHDSPAVLKRYSEKFGADPARWQFLTGPKLEIARLATESLKLTALEKPVTEQTAENDLFIHSTIFVLVDRHGKVRGTFESDDGAMPGKLAAAAAQLERER